MQAKEEKNSFFTQIQRELIVIRKWQCMTPWLFFCLNCLGKSLTWHQLLVLWTNASSIQGLLWHHWERERCWSITCDSWQPSRFLSLSVFFLLFSAEWITLTRFLLKSKLLSKTFTFGSGCCLLAVSIYFHQWAVYIHHQLTCS